MMRNSQLDYIPTFHMGMLLLHASASIHYAVTYTRLCECIVIVKVLHKTVDHHLDQFNVWLYCHYVTCIFMQ